MSNDRCKNCGATLGLHNYKDGRCPLGGFEASVGRKQEWQFTKFEPVEAVNAHEQLVEALQGLLDAYADHGLSTLAMAERWDAARAALELAQKGTK